MGLVLGLSFGSTLFLPQMAISGCDPEAVGSQAAVILGRNGFIAGLLAGRLAGWRAVWDPQTLQDDVMMVS